MARHNALSEEAKQAIALDYLAGMSQTDIADKHRVSASTVCKLVGEMKMSEIKEKEPAAAATATDSKENDLHVYVQDTTTLAECQALRGVEMIGVMQSMLIAAEGDFGNEIDIMALKADSDTAEPVFKYGGKAYQLSFGIAF